MHSDFICTKQSILYKWCILLNKANIFTDMHQTAFVAIKCSWNSRFSKYYSGSSRQNQLYIAVSAASASHFITSSGFGFGWGMAWLHSGQPIKSKKIWQTKTEWQTIGRTPPYRQSMKQQSAVLLEGASSVNGLFNPIIFFFFLMSIIWAWKTNCFAA